MLKCRVFPISCDRWMKKQMRGNIKQKWPCHNSTVSNNIILLFISVATFPNYVSWDLISGVNSLIKEEHFLSEEYIQVQYHAFQFKSEIYWKINILSHFSLSSGTVTGRRDQWINNLRHTHIVFCSMGSQGLFLSVCGTWGQGQAWLILAVRQGRTAAVS